MRECLCVPWIVRVSIVCFGTCCYLWTFGAYQDKEQAWVFTVLVPKQYRAFAAISFMNGAQLQQFAMHTVCSLDRIYLHKGALSYSSCWFNKFSEKSGIDVFFKTLRQKNKAWFSYWFLLCFLYLLILIFCFEAVTCIFKITILSRICKCL